MDWTDDARAIIHEQKLQNELLMATMRDIEQAMGVQKGMLSPRDETLIRTFENNHVSLAQFQAAHGLVPDGILGPKTQKVIDDLAYQRSNTAWLEREAALLPAVTMPEAFKAFMFGPNAKAKEPAPVLCPFTALFVGENTIAVHCQDTKARHANHFVEHEGYRVSWLENQHSYWKRSPWEPGMWISTTDRTQDRSFGVYRPGHVQAPPFAHAKAQTVQHAQQINAASSVPKFEIRDSRTGAVYTTDDPNEFVRMSQRLNKSLAAMTKEEYAARFDKLGWHLQRDRKWGWHVYVDLHEGGQWAYWRPFRSWAERTGSKRTLREVEDLERIYESQQVESFSVKNLGVSPSSEELTEELYEQEVRERRAALSDWDSAFSETENKTTPSTDIVLHEKRAS